MSVGEGRARSKFVWANWRVARWQSLSIDEAEEDASSELELKELPAGKNSRAKG